MVVTTEIFYDPQAYVDMTAWREAAVALHGVGKIHRIAAEGFTPFWAVIGHADVLDIERQPELFTNAPEPVLVSESDKAARDAVGGGIRTLIHMDAPDHNKYRKLTNDWFKPASVRRMTHRLDELSQRALATMEAAGGSLDFNNDVAIMYPLQVILDILGLPEADYPRMLKLTQELFGAQDPDLQRPMESAEDLGAVLFDFYNYFMALTNARRAEPVDDLASLIANGLIDDAPMGDLETMGYYVIIATAGHDTTSASMAEGMERLARNPNQLALLRDNPELIKNAVDEMIRLSSPVRHFMREAQADCEIAGQHVSKGDWLMLSYLAANVDPDGFEDPLRFDVQRTNADRHIAFGFGVHFCLGAQLARMELRSLYSTLVPRLASVEIAGEPTTSKATFVSGHKTLPIRYQLTSR